MSGFNFVAGALCVIGFMALIPFRATAQCEQLRITQPSPGYQNLLGRAVAISGDWAAVGIPNYNPQADTSGAVRFFHRSSGAWHPMGAVRSFTSVEAHVFGWSVALDDPRCVIGATADSAVTNSGRAYVFERASDRAWNWSELHATDIVWSDRFGFAVDIDGDRVAVGAPFDAGGGSVFVFDRDTRGNWNQVARLQAINGGGQTGYCVGLSGDIVVAGAPDDPTQGNYAGAAYVFERTADGHWAQKARLLASDGGPFSGYGFNVAISGTTIVCGAPEVTGNAMYSGAVYVYERQSDGSWPQVQRLIASNGERGDGLGRSVAIDGDLLVAGAPGVDTPGPGWGAVYVFDRDSSGAWHERAGWTIDNSSSFGYSVALDGNYAVVGLPFETVEGVENAGAAYIFALGPDTDGDGTPDPCQCPGDIDHDGEVTLFDLAVVLSNFGLPSEATRPLGDLDSDSDIDLTDLAILLASFGATCM